MSVNRPIVILGGGISGLSCAYYLYKFAGSLIAPRKIIVLESSKHVGGWMKTLRRDDGTVREIGPRSIRSVGNQGFNTLALADEIGLAEEVIGIPFNSPPAYKRYIYVDNQLHELPSKLVHLISKCSPFKNRLLPYVLKDLRTPKTDISQYDGDITVHDFIERRMGEEVANYFFNPLCRGVAAGDSKKLSILSTFPEIFKSEQMMGSVIKGMASTKRDYSQFINTSALASFAHKKQWSFWNFTNGVERLPEKLCEHLISRDNNPIEVHNQSAVYQIDFNQQDMTSTLKVRTPSEDITIETDYLFSTLPSKQLAKCLSHSNEYSTLHKTLDSIESVHVGVVSLEYKGKVMPKIEGFGFLVPSFVESKILGITYDSKVFPNFDGNNDITSITVMLGGDKFEQIFGSFDSVKESDILTAAIETARETLKIKEEPFRYQVWMHKNAIPQYHVGHTKKLQTIDQEIKNNNLNMILLGSSYKGLSVNDCIYNARNTCEQFAKELSAF